MQAAVYANLTTRRLTTTLGGSAISFPAFVQGDMVRIGLEEAPPLILTDVTKGEKEP